MKSSSLKKFWGAFGFGLSCVGATAVIWQIPAILATALRSDPPPEAFRICWLFTAILIPGAIIAFIAAWRHGQRHLLVRD